MRRSAIGLSCALCVLILSGPGCGARPEQADGRTVTAEPVVLIDAGPLAGLTAQLETAQAQPLSLTAAPTERSAEAMIESVRVGPVIALDNRGAPPRSPVYLDIPHSVGGDQLTVAFFQDGSKEAVAAVAQTEESLLLATMRLEDLALADVSRSRLDAIRSVDTGFRPGRDDFPFANAGSFFTTGDCAGQTLAMAWHYRHHGAPTGISLFDQYDNNGADPTPDFWQDDSLTLRLAASVQLDSKRKQSREFFEGFCLKRSAFDGAMLLAEPDTLQFYSLKYAMLASGRPQGIAVMNDTDGHSLLAYRIEDDRIFVCDPNHPGDQDRFITFEHGRFSPYDGGGTRYDQVYWYGEFSLVQEETIERRWQEVFDRDLFNDWFEHPQILLDRGTHADPGRLAFSVELSPSIASKLRVTLYRPGDRTLHDIEEPLYQSGQYRFFELEGFAAGEARIGFWLHDAEDGWYDFQWIQLSGESAYRLEADRELYQPGETAVIRLIGEGAEADPFGLFCVDGDRSATIGQGSVARYPVPAEGSETVRIECLDEAGNTLAELVLKIQRKPQETGLTRIERETEIYFVDPQGRRQGERTIYYDEENTRPSAILPYLDDELHGLCRYYFETGALQMEETMAHGIREGIAREYNRDGQVIMVEPYANNLLHGVKQIYADNGTLREETPYERGKKHGLSREYDRDGLLQREILYEEGEAVSVTEVR